MLIGSFSNNDGDDNEAIKKAPIGKTKTLQVHHAFL